MDFRHELTYDAPPPEVFAMLADPAFREAVSEAQGVVSHDVEVTRQGSGFTLVNDQVQRTEGLPSFAKKFAGSTTRAVQREEWADESGGSLVIEAPGKPSDIRGSISLEPAGPGTTEVVALAVTVKVPLVGGKLEGLLADQIRSGMDIEHEVGRRWLAGDR
ncbi:MAG TPA: DUF2505 domain-containing protein [Nocardioides sp.]